MVVRPGEVRGGHEGRSQTTAKRLSKTTHPPPPSDPWGGPPLNGVWPDQGTDVTDGGEGADFGLALRAEVPCGGLGGGAALAALCLLSDDCRS